MTKLRDEIKSSYRIGFNFLQRARWQNKHHAIIRLVFIFDLAGEKKMIFTLALMLDLSRN